VCGLYGQFGHIDQEMKFRTLLGIKPQSTIPFFFLFLAEIFRLVVKYLNRASNKTVANTETRHKRIAKYRDMQQSHNYLEQCQT
jgi:hypothetical protein